MKPRINLLKLDTEVKALSAQSCRERRGTYLSDRHKVSIISVVSIVYLSVVRFTDSKLLLSSRPHQSQRGNTLSLNVLMFTQRNTQTLLFKA